MVFMSFSNVRVPMATHYVPAANNKCRTRALHAVTSSAT
uniref:Uncharacterized protein n=1 Tax=Brassica oleracea TaxID=3712 RepID=A0A3P6DMV2_BRAOL|nr:unnamed protein product [Brassica oleracea]